MSFITCLVFSSSALAQNTALPKGTVATVNGIAITYDDISLAEDELIGLVGQLPERKRFETLLAYMIERVLAAEAARKAGLANDEAVALRRAFMERKALQDVYVGRQLMTRVTDKEVAAYYQKEIANAPRQKEVRARHILVNKREDADAVVAALADGGDFVALAKARSKGPSATSGGDLGFFGRDSMVEPFAAAAFKLEKGAVSAPVQTQFGWHVIKVEDTRTKPTPPLEDVRDQIYQILIGEARREIYQNLRETAKVTYVNVAPVSE